MNRYGNPSENIENKSMNKKINNDGAELKVRGHEI